MSSSCIPGTSVFDLITGDGDLAPIVRGSDDMPYDEILLTASKCMAAGRVIRVNQRQRVNLQLQVTDVNGVPLDLSLPGEVEPAEEGSSEGSSEGPPPACPVVFVAKEAWRARLPYIAVWAYVSDAVNGRVEVPLSRDYLEKAGLFYAQLVALTEDLTAASAVTNYWLEVAPSLAVRTKGPLTIAEIRMELRDVCGEENMLLGDVEFKDEEIVHAISKPIEEFNESLVPATNFTAVTFPFRFNWRRAAVGYLLQTAAWHYERNNLKYSAGDVSIADKDKFAVYNREAVRLLAEWRDFIGHKKVEMNAKRAWGYSRSPLARGSRYRR